MALQETSLHEAFRGESENKLDSKGRVSIPADFRKILEAEDPERGRGAAAMVIVYGPTSQRWLLGYSLETVKRKDREILLQTDSGKKKRILQDNFIKKSLKVQLDSSGRVTLSAALRAKSLLELNGSVCFAGVGDHFEIWSPDLYAQKRSQEDDAFESAKAGHDDWTDVSHLIEFDIFEERKQSREQPSGESF